MKGAIRNFLVVVFCVHFVFSSDDSSDEKEAFVWIFWFYLHPYYKYISYEFESVNFIFKEIGEEEVCKNLAYGSELWMEFGIALTKAYGKVAFKQLAAIGTKVWTLV